MQAQSQFSLLINGEFRRGIEIFAIRNGENLTLFFQNGSVSMKISLSQGPCHPNVKKSVNVGSNWPETHHYRRFIRIK